MTYHERDGWDEVGDQGNGILGGHLKYVKGRMFLDKAEIKIGDHGIKLCIIMDSATAGKVLWQDQRIAERDVGRVASGFMPRRAEIQESWNPYVSFQAVRADEGHLGEVVTFTSSSWGGWYAFEKLINPYRLKERRQFPVITIATKDRGDENNTIDPVFKITSLWSARENFPDLLPPPIAPAAEAIAYSPPAKPDEPSLAEVLDDDIPF